MLKFNKLDIGFISLTKNIDTNTPLGAVAQLELDIIAERVRNGLANAKAKIKEQEEALLPKLDLEKDYLWAIFIKDTTLIISKFILS